MLVVPVNGQGAIEAIRATSDMIENVRCGTRGPCKFDSCENGTKWGKHYNRDTGFCIFMAADIRTKRYTYRKPYSQNGGRLIEGIWIVNYDTPDEELLTAEEFERDYRQATTDDKRQVWHPCPLCNKKLCRIELGSTARKIYLWCKHCKKEIEINI